MALPEKGVAAISAKDVPGGQTKVAEDHPKINGGCPEKEQRVLQGAGKQVAEENWPRGVRRSRGKCRGKRCGAPVSRGLRMKKKINKGY